MRSILVGSLMLLLIGGAGGAGAGEERGLPPSVREVLAEPDVLEVVSLDPNVHRPFGYGEGSEAPEPLKRWRVTLAEADGILGRVRVDDPAIRRSLLEGLEAGLAHPGPPAGCYEPRHALVARKGDVTVAVHLCFACNFALLLEAGTQTARLTSLGDPQALQSRLNGLLKAAGAPLAPPLGDGPVAAPVPADGALAAFRDPDALAVYAIDMDVYRGVGHSDPPAGQTLLGHALALLDEGLGVKAQATLTRPSARAAILADVERGLAMPGAPAECYNPRHAIVVTKGSERVVAFLCFECFYAAVAHARTSAGTGIVAFEEPGRLQARLDMILAAAPPRAGPTAFDVVLLSMGHDTIGVIKVVRELTALGLKDAKDLAERAPTSVLTKVERVKAESAVKALRAVGAGAEFRPHAP